MIDASVQTDGADNLETLMYNFKASEEYKNLIGEWIPIGAPKINDMVKIAAPFVDATVGVQVQLAADTIGQIVNVDKEGDAEIHFPSLTALYPRERYRWILADHFKHMTKLGDL